MNQVRALLLIVPQMNECPCLATLEAFGISSSSSMDVVVDGGTYQYPSVYGSGKCTVHDANMEPSCSFRAFDCTEVGQYISIPHWCGSPWCFVNGSACAVRSLPTGSGGMQISGLVDPNGELHYSYRACGACDTELFATRSPTPEKATPGWYVRTRREKLAIALPTTALLAPRRVAVSPPSTLMPAPAHP